MSKREMDIIDNVELYRASFRYIFRHLDCEITIFYCRWKCLWAYSTEGGHYKEDLLSQFDAIVEALSHVELDILDHYDSIPAYIAEMGKKKVDAAISDEEWIQKRKALLERYVNDSSSEIPF